MSSNHEQILAAAKRLNELIEQSKRNIEVIQEEAIEAAIAGDPDMLAVAKARLAAEVEAVEAAEKILLEASKIKIMKL